MSYYALNGYYSLGASHQPVFTHAQLSDMGYTDNQIMMLHRLVRNNPGKSIQHFMQSMRPAASWEPLTRTPFGWPKYYRWCSMSKKNVTWSEDFYFPGHNRTIEFNADSYNDWVRKTAYYIDPKYLANDNFAAWTKRYPLNNVPRKIENQIRKETRAPMFFAPQPKLYGKKEVGGGWKLGVRTLPYYTYGAIAFLEQGLKRKRLALYEQDWDCFAKGSVMFTGPVHIPILSRAGEAWMSLTPSEILTLREGNRIAKGHTLVAGLGMGWLTQKLKNMRIEFYLGNMRNHMIF